MNQRKIFLRKLAYLAGCIVLFIPMYFLCPPTSVGENGERLPGGVLAELREDYGISQANLGEIDPAGEAIKLATLGMRGLAANILWGKANEYKMKEDWTSLSASLEQLTKLQPNFIRVWQFQSWNLAYNVSVEFDNYRDRYYWVIKGINFQREGIRYNANEPRMIWDVGWTISQKIGRSDEHKEFRVLFRDDDDFHGPRPKADRDNWLVGREWYLQAQDVADKYGLSVKSLGAMIYQPEKIQKTMSPLTFYSYAPMNLINYADMLEEEGTFGELARVAWQKAKVGWQEYGNRELPTSFNVDVHLNDSERLTEQAEAAKAELDKLAPGVEEKLKQEKDASVSPAEREAMAVPMDKRSTEQSRLASSGEMKLKIMPLDIARRAPEKDRTAALQAADVAQRTSEAANIIDIQREVVNFKFWRLRCEMEEEPTTVEARGTLYEAEKAARQARLGPAQELYDKGFAAWRKVFDKYPDMLTQNTVTETIGEVVDRYERFLQQFSAKLPDPFILQDVLDADPNRPKKTKKK